MNQVDWIQAPADAFVGVFLTGRPIVIAHHLRVV